MFTGNMLENEVNSLEIPEFDDEVVRGMLEYIYTEETKVMAERAPELLQIAEKYDLEGLKEDCEYAVAATLNQDNVVAMLVLAHKYNAVDLKQRTVSFINKNKEELLKSKSFQDAVKANADTEIFADLYFSEQ